VFIISQLKFEKSESPILVPYSVGRRSIARLTFSQDKDSHRSRVTVQR